MNSNFKKYLFIYLCYTGSLLQGRLFSSCAEQGLPFCCGVQASHCGGFSCCSAWVQGYTGPVVLGHRLSCSTACRIFLDQGSNLCLLHWQVDSLPLSHQGSPIILIYCEQPPSGKQLGVPEVGKCLSVWRNLHGVRGLDRLQSANSP